MLPPEATCAVILGYGVPRDILQDGNYRNYLQEAYEIIRRRGIMNIVFCGGHTNIHHPEKSEAAEMQRLFEQIHAEHLATIRSATAILLAGGTQNIVLLTDVSPEEAAPRKQKIVDRMQAKLEEQQAAHEAIQFHYIRLENPITSFENIAGLDVVMTINHFFHATVFCEKSRRFKILLLCKKLLQPEKSANVVGIDFDASRTLIKDAKQVVDYFLTWLQFIFPSIGYWRNRRQRCHIARVSQK